MKIKQFDLLLRETSACEWGNSDRVVFTDSNDVYDFVTAEGLIDLGSRPNERLVTIAVNVKGEPIGYTVSSIGELSATTLSPRAILQFCLECNAAGVIVCHNHPSQDVTPSHEDILATRRLEDACKIMQISLVDHLIVSNQGYTSFRSEGLMSS